MLPLEISLKISLNRAQNTPFQQNQKGIQTKAPIKKAERG
jgi:hypothetical protein